MPYVIEQNENDQWQVFDADNGKAIGDPHDLRRAAVMKMQELQRADAKKAAEKAKNPDDDSDEEEDDEEED